MEQLIQKLSKLSSVKAVRRESGPVLKIELFSRPLKHSEAVEIKGDLRSITPKIRSKLDEARDSGEISSWQWIVRPKKQYQETKLGRDKVTDRKDGGHKPGFYRVDVRDK